MSSTVTTSEISAGYRRFGEREARGESPTYERLALAVADDLPLLQRLAELPEPKRQPNLLFGAGQYLGGPVADPNAFHDWALANWSGLVSTMRHRRTQTNEVGRCASLLPVLARLAQPLALLEVGASAGLCLYPDAYRYRYRSLEPDDRLRAPSSLAGQAEVLVGPVNSPVQVDCLVDAAVPLPEQVPTVVWRAGLDLNPLDVRDEDDLRWLEALIWPEQQERRARLRAAAGIVQADPPQLVRGDLLTGLPALAAQAPRDATLVVFHSAVLNYLPLDGRATFVEVVQTLPGHWISNEAIGVIPGLTGTVPVRPNGPAAFPEDGPATFVVALDGQPVALAAPHGQALRWLERE